MKKILLAFFVLLFAVNLFGQEVCKQTIKFAEKDGQELFLDLYSSSDEVQPCVIYVFGGGFAGGQRDHELNVDFLRFLAKEGYKVAAIDYRLGLAEIATTGQDLKMRQFVDMFINAVVIATEDLYTATNYVLDNAELLNIDKETIIACGSSAGGITVLQGEYGICNNTEIAQVLPEGFNYAGIISFAGAIMELEGRLRWANKPCPIQMFHGKSDSNVPFNKMGFLGMRFWGSNRIVRSLDKIESPYYFYEALNVNHSLAVTPQNRNRDEICLFLDRYVKEKKPLMTHKLVDNLSLPKIKHRFRLKEYIRSNFSPTALEEFYRSLEEQ